MAKMCRRLSAVERVRIELGLRDGLSLTRIAEAIGRPKGTVSKEIARHGGAGAYAADAAHIQSVGVPRGGRPNRLKPGKCQSASESDPRSACKVDPLRGWWMRDIWV